MLFINVKSRLLNKAFWISLISLIVLLSQEFGFDISTIIPKNYTDIVKTIFAILALIGIVVDTSTPGINDKIIQDATASASDKEAERNVDTTSNIQVITKETMPVVDVVALQEERDSLKAQLDSIQSVVNGIGVTA